MFDRPTNTSAYCSDEKTSTTPILSYQTIKSHRIVNAPKTAKKSGTKLCDLSVVGLGLTGTLLSTGFANQGHKVIAVDTDLDKIGSINQGNSPILDAEIQQAVATAKQQQNLIATADLHHAILKSQVTLVCIGSELTSKGDTLLSNLHAVCKQIGLSLKQKDTYHLVLVHSGLRANICADRLIPVIEQWSDKKCGVEFGVCYLPLFITYSEQGESATLIENILHGAFDNKSAKMATSLFHSLDIGLKAVRLATSE
jgi:nucleotide sugar dehydrogenase